jgi:Arc/MetJ family transcription regulator
MRTTITIEDELWERAKEYLGTNESSEVVRRALKSAVAAEATRRLVALGGTMPDLYIRGHMPEDRG